MNDDNFNYNPQQIERYWQAQWLKQHAFATDTSKNSTQKPFYVLEMFPYPSGDLHMGHVRNYTIGDVFARYRRMQGDCVLHPMGFDALGLPAENQAIIEKIAPQVRTPKNIARMKEQMCRLGLAYDWQREIATYKDDYYRWNQWFFLKFLEKGLVYRRTTQVNFCPGCNTILANEQVLDNQTCWRGHTDVTTRSIPEWAFKMTAYADALLADLDGLQAWPERIVTQQRNWLGKSTGATLDFKAAVSHHILTIFTTRPDTLYGCTALILSPEHPDALALTTPEQKKPVEAFITRVRAQDKITRTALGTQKEGVFTGAYAIHPCTKQHIPIWLGNFVLADYGTGAVMAVPAHDARDLAFANTYDLPIKQVINDAGVLYDSGEFSDMPSTDARLKIIQFAERAGFGKQTTHWHVRDWGFSRQRYWGTPIPIIYCQTHGAVPVPEADLPVRLPDFADVELTGRDGAPLAKLASFKNTTCPICQGPATREVETMDTFVDSAWYFARFTDPHCTHAPFDSAVANQYLPIDIYVGGPEHAVMHLLYFRFWTKAMRDLGLVNISEPAVRLITQGMVNAPAYRCPKHGYVPVKDINQTEPRCPSCGDALPKTIEKMSKSKYNGIDPMDLINTYGADTARLYILFAAPPEKDLEWNQDGVEGLYRFVNRVWRLLMAQKHYVQDATDTISMQQLQGDSKAIYQAVHQTLAKVTQEMQSRNHFNTAIASIMDLVNTLHHYKLHETNHIDKHVIKHALTLLAQMLAPFAPHLAEAIWHDLGHAGLIVHATWPPVDEAACVLEYMSIAVQINGKLRGNILLPVDKQEVEAALACALQETNIIKHVANKTIQKTIFVPKRLLNIIVS